MKFCKNCGNQLVDNSQFCSNCGTPVAAPVSVEPVAPSEPVTQPYVAPSEPVTQPYVAPSEPVTQPYVAPSEPVAQPYVAPSEPVAQPYISPAYAQPVKSNNSKIGMIAFAIIVILVCILAYFLIFKNLFGGTYKTPIKNLVNAMEDQNIKKYYKAMPDYQVEEIKTMIDEYFDGDDSIIWEAFSEYEDLKMDYSIEDKEKLDKDELEVIEEDVEYYYDEKVKVSAGYEVDVELIIKFDGEKETETVTMTVVKMDGRWVVYEGGSIF